MHESSPRPRIAVRWLKLIRDLRAERGRAILMVAAIAVSLLALETVLGAYSILTREMPASYLGTRPASATLDVSQGVSPELVAAVRRHPLVAEAEAREVILARARVGGDWRRLLLFVVDDFADQRLNIFRPTGGAWPPPDGTMLVERSAVPMLQTTAGHSILVKAPHGAPTEVAVSGLVHDPGLAPAWQEMSGYGYITRRTAARLGEPSELHELRIELRGRPTDARVIEAGAAELARWLASQGVAVHELRVPPPAQHPHQRQMTTVLLMMLGFSVVALLLSGVLVANSLAAMLARQVREIGVMKAVGARPGQLGVMYAALVGTVGAAALAVSLPSGVLAARAFAGAIASMLNFDLASRSIPHWVFAAQVAAGVLVPLLVAAFPVVRASARTVRESLNDHGASRRTGTLLPFLPGPLRNAVRRPARLALTLTLLASAGAMFMTAINVKRGWEANVAKVYETRTYDLEVQLQQPHDVSIGATLERLPLVGKVEPWGLIAGAFARPGEIDVVRTYPDRGHGSLLVMAPPAQTSMVRFPVKAGRWIAPDDREAVVLNHVAAAQMPGLKVGDDVLLSLGGRPSKWTLAGIVEEIGSPGTAYVGSDAFAKITATIGQARMLRIATRSHSPEERSAAIRSIEQELARAGASVESVIPLAVLRTAVGDHILILIRALIGMAIILAVVGTLGLASSMGTSVVERTRELAVMRTLGATPRHIARLLLGEGMTIGMVSWVIAFGLSIPLTLYVDGLIGRLGFLADLPLIVSTPAVAGWLAAVAAVSFTAVLWPARRASAIPVRDALGRV